MESVLFFPIFALSGHNPVLDFIMRFSAVYLIYLAFALITIAALKGKIAEKRALFISILGLGFALIFIELIRLVYFEPRPYVTHLITPLIPFTTEASFPSKHTAIISVLAFTYLHYKSKLAGFLLICLVLIGFSRIYVGVHYPLDILGGVIIGLASFKFSVFFKNKFKRYLS